MRICLPIHIETHGGGGLTLSEGSLCPLGYSLGSIINKMMMINPRASATSALQAMATHSNTAVRLVLHYSDVCDDETLSPGSRYCSSSCGDCDRDQSTAGRAQVVVAAAISSLRAMTAPRCNLYSTIATCDHETLPPTSRYCFSSCGD